MIFRVLGSVTFFRLVQPEKQPLGTSSIPSGRLALLSEVQLRNASLPRYLTFAGISAVSSAVQAKKAELPISSRESGKLTVSSAVQPLNAPSSILFRPSGSVTV